MKFNGRQKSLRILFVIYVDKYFLLEKVRTCHDNPEKSYETKLNKHTVCGSSLFTHCSFGSNKTKHVFYSGMDSMKKLCKYLRGHASKIINSEKEEMLPLTKKEEKDRGVARI